MKIKETIFELRTKNGLSQEELAEKTGVSEKDISDWESGEAVPNDETLKLLSKCFDVSVNTLLGSQKQLICQCCGMPLEDSGISRETDGSFNEEYCKWCYADGKFNYQNKEQLVDFLVEKLSDESFPPEKARSYFEELLPKLNHWKSEQ